jgi:TolA-binding protein
MKKLFVIPFIILCVSCSSESGKLMQEARKLEASKKAPEALKLYEKIVHDSPGSSQAPEALFHCGELYQTVSKDIMKSASTFESIMDRYPESEFAHKGLFTAGFIFDEQLKNFSKAKSLYEKYLSRYPDSSSAKEVKFLLKNLGRSNDEILQSLQDTTAKQKETAGK